MSHPRASLPLPSPSRGLSFNPVWLLTRHCAQVCTHPSSTNLQPVHTQHSQDSSVSACQDRVLQRKGSQRLFNQTCMYSCNMLRPLWWRANLRARTCHNKSLITFLRLQDNKQTLCLLWKFSKRRDPGAGSECNCRCMLEKIETVSQYLISLPFTWRTIKGGYEGELNVIFL